MAELDIDYIKYNIQEILLKNHKNPVKHKIITRSDRLSFACPICGDSNKNPYLKRGHLFFNNLYYKCYNEDCRSNFTKLCKTNNIIIDPTKRMEIINYIDLNFHTFNKSNDDWMVKNLDLLINFEHLQEWFDSGEGPLINFKRPGFGSSVYTYLLNRGFTHDIITSQFYEGIKVIGSLKIPYIVFLNTFNGRVVGMQERNLKSGKDRRFKIWTFSELYKSIYEKQLDEIDTISYNKLSYLFNIFNVNYDKPINIFEGYIDSLFMPNSIGSVGADTDYSILTNNEVDVRLFFDNDNKGKRKSLYWLKRGFTVFLWEKLINDLAQTQLDPFTWKLWFNHNIKDLNDLVLKLNIHYKQLEKYFSTSLFDTIYINVMSYKKEKELIKKTETKNTDINDIINQLKIKSNKL